MSNERPLEHDLITGWALDADCWRLPIKLICALENRFSSFLILQFLQRGDLRLQPRGDLLKFLRLRRLRFLKVFHGGLLFGFGLAVFGITELLLGFFDLCVHFLCRCREFLERRLTEYGLPILQGNGGKVRNRVFYFFDGSRINRRRWICNGRLCRRLRSDRRRGALSGGGLAAGLEKRILGIALGGEVKPKGRGRNTQKKGNQYQNDNPNGSPFSGLPFVPETNFICRCQSHCAISFLLSIPSDRLNLPRFIEPH
jgi:hypothetical protein